MVRFLQNSSYLFNLVPQIYPLGPARDGVLAVRVWKASLDSFDTGLQGGFSAPPLVGSAAALADRLTNYNYNGCAAGNICLPLIRSTFWCLF